MREQICQQCGKTFGLNELVSIFGEVMCRPCGDERLNTCDREQISEQTVFGLSDPTVCARCGADGGSQEYELFLDMPICPTCHDTMVNYRYPAWVKAFFAGLLIITVFSLVWNFRFFKARIFMEQGIRAGFLEGNLERGAEKMGRAVEMVPESYDLGVLSHYFEGVLAMQKDDTASAIVHFQHCSELPEGYEVKRYMLISKIGEAFDQQEYEKFLELAIQYREHYPDDVTAAAQVASAYACLYAVSGEAPYHEKAMEQLRRAEVTTTAETRTRFEEFQQRILHRLETRRIISREDYYKETGKTPPEELQ